MGSIAANASGTACAADDAVRLVATSGTEVVVGAQEMTVRSALGGDEAARGRRLRSTRWVEIGPRISVSFLIEPSTASLPHIYFRNDAFIPDIRCRQTEHPQNVSKSQNDNQDDSTLSFHQN